MKVFKCIKCNQAPQIEIITNAVSTSGSMFFIDRVSATENLQNILELGLTYILRRKGLTNSNYRKPSSTV